MKQREVDWTERGDRETGKLLDFVPLPDGDQCIDLFAIVETEGGYVRAIDVNLYTLHFTHTAEGVKYE